MSVPYGFDGDISKPEMLASTSFHNGGGARERFTGKVVLITGASGGVGAVLADSFACEGAITVLADVNRNAGEALERSLRDRGHQAMFVTLDVSNAGDWSAAMERIQSEFGALHVLVNNAGIISRTGIRDVTSEEWQRVLNVNLMGSMLGIQSVAKLIRDSGGGSVVNVGSTSGVVGHPGVAYSASKWGLRALTRSAALDLLEWGIRVNAVHPSQVAGTGITKGANEGYRQASDRVMPAGRAVNAEEVASAVLFLASGESSYINATDLMVDGGAVSIGMPRMRSLLESEYSST
ncbi:SDR family oxidoreductase [Diaphorobacter sp. HDW4B]|uniref:SDR family NAD(P)-dependent oxidoreductase n=1 Tax=Diaphorobacter sp. HDW4B TaxID=2714925 RepID=UPI00140C448C|nr:SDR family NAD(P)-dependent oxidoreductase [Diaphorobacter sp. HDW4B]QIL69341.1 SDR family oxidoreductase [Diaphorobacter sp. HDW4B]